MGMKKTTRKQLRTIRRRRLALALAGALAMPAAPAIAQSLPTSGDVTHGSATIGQSGTHTTSVRGATSPAASVEVAISPPPAPGPSAAPRCASQRRVRP